MDVCGSETKDRMVRKSEGCYLKLDTSHYLNGRTPPVMSLRSCFALDRHKVILFYTHLTRSDAFHLHRALTFL